MSRVRLFVSLLLLLGAVAAFAADPPPGTVKQRSWLRPCLDSGSVTHDQYEYKCTSIESNVQVYNFYTRREYLKDAVYQVDRTPVSPPPTPKFYAYAVKQSWEVAESLHSAALVDRGKKTINIETVVEPRWEYKKKD